MRVVGDEVYLYATHDASPQSKHFVMHDWWIWRTRDMANWQLAGVLAPEQTFLQRPFDQCWAVDAVERDGWFYLYFSAGPEEIGVVRSRTPCGPWEDRLGKPLIARHSTPTAARDPGILIDKDGSAYIVFGAFDYYIARLGDDMMTLAETPRLVELDHKQGPFGNGRTGDKPYLHRRGDRYYLSWGCFYAVSDRPYGPFSYRGCIITPETTESAFRSDHLLYDRHSSFCEFRGRWYYAANDYSRPGTTSFFRDTVLCYVNYLDNGDIAPVRIDAVGVGRYDAAAGAVQAADYFLLEGPGGVRQSDGGFEVHELTDGSRLSYPNVYNVPVKAKLVLSLSGETGKGARVEVRNAEDREGPLGSVALPAHSSEHGFRQIEVPLVRSVSTMNVQIVFVGSGSSIRLRSWQMEQRV